MAVDYRVKDINNKNMNEHNARTNYSESKLNHTLPYFNKYMLFCYFSTDVKRR